MKPEMVELMKTFEDFFEVPFPNDDGEEAVGYGHVCQQEGCAELSARYTFPLDEETGSQLL